MVKSLRLVLPVCCLLPAACATPGGGSLGFVALDPNQHVSGAEPLFGNRGRERDAASLLGVFIPTSAGAAEPTNVHPCTRIEHAMKWALQSHPGTRIAGAPYSKEARNEVIGMLMADSDIKCDKYTQFIEQYNSNVKTGFGVLGHAATTIAAITTGGAAQALASGASIATNASSQLDKAHFQEQTIPIVVAAYQTARAEVRREIDRGMRKSAGDYALSTGMRDAVRYHSNCSVVAGIRATGQAVQEKAARDDAKEDDGDDAGGANGNDGGGNAGGDTDTGGAGNAGGATGNGGGGNADGNGDGSDQD